MAKGKRDPNPIHLYPDSMWYNHPHNIRAGLRFLQIKRDIFKFA